MKTYLLGLCRGLILGSLGVGLAMDWQPLPYVTTRVPVFITPQPFILLPMPHAQFDQMPCY